MKKIGSLLIIFFNIVASSTYDLALQKKNIYVDEKMSFVLRFTTDEKDVSLVSAQDPEVDGIKIIEVSKPVVKDNSVEILGSLYATRSGDIEIPPLSLKYRVAKKIDRDENQLLSFLFVRPFETKVVYTKPIVLHVEDLPELPKELASGLSTPNQAKPVGQFGKFVAEISPKKISNNSAATYRLILEGEGNWEKIDAPVLVLPEGLKYYISKMQVVDGKKIFEYIVQPVDSGNFEIPQQEFIFFDTKTKKYKKILSNLVYLEVEKVQVPVKKEDQKQKLIEQVMSDKDIEIYEPEKFIPANFLLLLLLIPVIARILASLWIIVLNRTRKYRVIFYARRKLKLAYKKNRVEEFYDIIREAVARYFNLSINQVTDDDIKNKFESECANIDLTHSYEELNIKLLAHTRFAHSTSAREDITRELYAKCLKFLRQLKNAKCGMYVLILFCSVQVFASFTSAIHSTSTIPNIPPVRCSLSVSGSEHSESKDNNILALANLRREQQSVSSNKLLKLESEIKDIKEKAGAKYIDRFDNIFGKIFINFNYIPLIVWQIILIICWWILILFVSMMNKRLKILTILLLVLSSSAVIIIMHVRSMRFGIIKNDNLEIFLAPKINIIKEKASKAEFLDDVKILKCEDDWYYIKVQNDTGWIRKKDLEIV